MPFGAGSRLCPGSDLAKLVITTFLHYVLLNYKYVSSKLSNMEYILLFSFSSGMKYNRVTVYWRSIRIPWKIQLIKQSLHF